MFDGLLPESHNQAIMRLLFIMAHWHALAKLHMHNDCTLNVMQAVTVSLGNELRKFSQTTCSAFETKELRKEYNARIRCEANAAAKKACGATDLLNSTDEAHPAQTNPTGSLVSDLSPIQPGPSGQHLRTFNLSTYKGHSLGDCRYYQAVWHFRFLSD